MTLGSVDRIVQSWDTANKATELSDFSVCASWGVKDKNRFLLGVCRRQLEYPALRLRAIFAGASSVGAVQTAMRRQIRP
jgi:phage terminase large subunit-like protein